MASLREKFRGCLLGAAVGDIAGAPVEGEFPNYIAKTYRTIDEILAAGSVPELVGPDWQVGRFTDDTQMTLCVAEWLIEDGDAHPPERLLARFAEAYEPWRRYGPGAASILQAFPRHRAEWRALATASFPEGSFGNGSAMRVAPVGLAYFDDPRKAAAVAIESSRPTHSHRLAYQGAVLQCVAVAVAVATAMSTAAAAAATAFDPATFLQPLRAELARFAELMQDTSNFNAALSTIESGLKRGATCRDMSEILGAGVAAHESVPIALYCFLRNPDSYEQCVREAVFIGGDTDTIASMAGAISGAFLGRDAIPSAWVEAVREERYTPAAIEAVADRLFERYARGA